METVARTSGKDNFTFLRDITKATDHKVPFGRKLLHRDAEQDSNRRLAHISPKAAS